MWFKLKKLFYKYRLVLIGTTSILFIAFAWNFIFYSSYNSYRYISPNKKYVLSISEPTILAELLYKNASTTVHLTDVLLNKEYRIFKDTPTQIMGDRSKFKGVIWSNNSMKCAYFETQWGHPIIYLVNVDNRNVFGYTKKETWLKKKLQSESKSDPNSLNLLSLLILAEIEQATTQQES